LSIVTLSLASLAPGSGPGGAQTARRPMTVEDVQAIQKLTAVVTSPDSEWIAAVVERPQTDREIYMRSHTRGDVWLIPIRGGARRNLTNGIADRSGFWSPVWSPDGARLAMLSTKGGDNVRLYVWDRRTGTITRVTERGVDMYTTINT